MPGEIAAAITSVRASLEIAKAMIGLRDGALMQEKSIELRGLILDSLDQAIAAREAQSSQLDRIRALETEIANLQAWGAEQQNYELVKLSRGAIAFMLKPHARGCEPPHWLCPTCFANGKKAFFQPLQGTGHFGTTYACVVCGSKMNVEARDEPSWRDRAT